MRPLSFGQVYQPVWLEQALNSPSPPQYFHMQVVDPYIEFEILLVFIDMQLMRKEARCLRSRTV